jgi:hypothetical protein
MALRVLTQLKTFLHHFAIDDEPVRVHLHRFTKEELVTFRKEVSKHEKRGTDNESDDDKEKRIAAGNAFTERCVIDYVTFEPGDVTDEGGHDIVTGAEIVRAFYNRQDVLDGLASALWAENVMGKQQKKTLRQLGTFSPGSKPSTATPVGGGPASTVARAAPAASVNDEAAMAGHGASRSGDAAE